jgi:hypothetical protein
MYEVDMKALLNDPAAVPWLRKPGCHCLVLLLEYVECPSDPRPVHGDPCGAEVSRCEMSRIRETVRLRLVPPRECDGAEVSAPVHQFLKEVQELRTRYPLGAGPTVVGAGRAPFQLRVTVNKPDGTVAQTVTVRPPPQNPSILSPGIPVGSLVVEVLLDPLWSFVGGTLSGQATSQSGPVSGIVQPPDPVDLALASGFNPGPLRITFSVSSTSTSPPSQVVFKLAGWQAQPLFAREDDPASSGDLTFTVMLGGAGVPGGPPATSGVQVTRDALGATTNVPKPLDIAALPCAGEPCTPQPPPSARSDCGGRSAASGGATDSTQDSSSDDLKALALAALGGWLAQMLVRERAGTAAEITSTRRELAQFIQSGAWPLLFGVSSRADRSELGGTLQRLLEGWCDGLLWKGPQCCGDPHGVPIACVIVEGGTITNLDPFCGRRYRLGYPLLEHWAAQFGIPPLDLTAMRFFSKLCCLAGLPAFSPTQPASTAQLITIGGGLAAMGDRSDIARKLGGKQIVDERRVGTLEMFATALTLFGTKPPPASSAQYTALVLDELVWDHTFMLLVPESA